MIDFPEFINLPIPALTNAGHLSFVNLENRDLFENCPKYEPQSDGVSLSGMDISDTWRN